MPLFEGGVFWIHFLEEKNKFFKLDLNHSLSYFNLSPCHCIVYNLEEEEGNLRLNKPKENTRKDEIGSAHKEETYLSVCSRVQPWRGIFMVRGYPFPFGDGTHQR